MNSCGIFHKNPAGVLKFFSFFLNILLSGKGKGELTLSKWVIYRIDSIFAKSVTIKPRSGEIPLAWGASPRSKLKKKIER
jgi:hypothetical protein